MVSSWRACVLMREMRCASHPQISFPSKSSRLPFSFLERDFLTSLLQQPSSPLPPFPSLDPPPDSGFLLFLPPTRHLQISHLNAVAIRPPNPRPEAASPAAASQQCPPLLRRPPSSSSSSSSSPPPPPIAAPPHRSARARRGRGWCRWGRRRAGSARWCSMRRGGGWGASSSARPAPAAVAPGAAACCPRAATPSTATSPTAPSASAPSPPSPATASAATSRRCSRHLLVRAICFFANEFVLKVMR